MPHCFRLNEWLGRISPTRSHTVESNDNISAEIPVSCANLALANVPTNERWCIDDWQNSTKLAVNLYKNLVDGDMLLKQRGNDLLIRTLLALNDNPFASRVIDWRKPGRHKCVDSTVVHAG